MSTIAELFLSLKDNHGYLTTSQAATHGVDRWMLTRLVQKGLLVRHAHGLYALPDIIPDPFVVAQHRCSLGIFSHETALCLHNLLKRAPLQLMMTIPSGWNTSLLKDPSMIFFYCRKDWFEIGLTSKCTLAGLHVRCYDVERTLCDCIRAVDRLDRGLVICALKAYMKRVSSDKERLLDYAGRFGVRDTAYQYLEANQ